MSTIAAGVAPDSVSIDFGDYGRREVDLAKSRQRCRFITAKGARTLRTSALTRLSASIAHEINQPVAALITNVHVALRSLESSEPDLKEVQHALNRIGRLGNRIVEVAGRMRGVIQKVPPRKEEFLIEEAICEVIANCQQELANNGVLVNKQFARGMPFLVADRILLQQVIWNLIKNAVDAMTQVSGRARVLSISTDRTPAGEILVTVQDSGPGVDPRRVDRIFDAFSSTKPGGLGIGLFICRSIITAHDGRLWATPNEPHGARFQFALPLYSGCAGWSRPDGRCDLEVRRAACG